MENRYWLISALIATSVALPMTGRASTGQLSPSPFGAPASFVVPFNLPAASGVAPLGGADDPRTKEFTIWVINPLLEVEYSPKGSNFSFGVGAGLVVSSNSDSTETKASISTGWLAEATLYPNAKQQGLAFIARGLDALGQFYIAPGLAYVSRPMGGGTNFRIGVTFPLGGGGLVPISPMLGIGWSF